MKCVISFFKVEEYRFVNFAPERRDIIFASLTFRKSLKHANVYMFETLFNLVFVCVSTNEYRQLKETLSPRMVSTNWMTMSMWFTEWPTVDHFLFFNSCWFSINTNLEFSGELWKQINLESVDLNYYNGTFVNADKQLYRVRR